MKGLSYIARIDIMKDKYVEESVKYRLDDLKDYAGMMANRAKLGYYGDAFWFASQMGSGG